MATTTAAAKQNPGESSQGKTPSVKDEQSLSRIQEKATNSQPSLTETESDNSVSADTKDKVVTFTIRVSVEDAKKVRKAALQWAAKQDDPPDNAVAGFFRHMCGSDK